MNGICTPENLKALDNLLEKVLVICDLLEKHQGHPDQSVHGRHHGGAGTSTEDKPGSGSEARSQRAKADYKASTKKKQLRAREEQAKFADDIKAQNIPGTKPFDVHAANGKIGIEVKTIQDNKNNKITMHPKSRRRKEKFAEDNRMKSIHTVGIDIRGTKRKYYYKEGVGAYRLNAMKRVSIGWLKGRLK